MQGPEQTMVCTQIAAAHLQNPDLVVALTAAQTAHHLASHLLEQAQVPVPCLKPRAMHTACGAAEGC